MSTRVHEPAPAPAHTPARSQFVQRDAASAASVPSAAPDSVHRTISSPGRPLDPDTRGYMEDRFGHDFSQVRVHTDSRAADSAREINAHAYTVGSDIAFAAGRYQPETSAGRQLLAHELAHTIQQSGLQRRASDLAVDTAPDSRLEHEAESAARAVAAGPAAPAIAARAPGPVVSRAGGGAATAPLPAPATTDVDLETEPSGFTGKLKHKVRIDGKAPAPGSKPSLRKFRADVFYMPGDKGEGAEAVYKQYASAKQLRAVVGFNGTTARTELWEARNTTEVLGDSWLQRVNWPVAEKDKRWQDITKQSHPFPKLDVSGTVQTAQIDHIVELQLGGANNPSNLRPLDSDPNGRSGRNIWQEVSSLAKAIRDEPKFAIDTADQIEIGFDSVTVDGAVWPATPAAAPWNALKVHTKAMADRTALAADANTKFIKLAAGANVEDFAVPANWGSANKIAELSTNSFNKSPAEMVSSMSFTHINWVNAQGISVDATFDLRNRTRVPMAANKAPDAAKAKFKLGGVLKNGAYNLSLTSKPQGLVLDYPFLSPLSIKTYALNPQGDLDWTGTLKSTVGFLGELGVSYAGGELRVTKGLDPATLKSKKILGISLNKADVSLVLSPVENFRLQADLGLSVGPAEKPFLKGDISIKASPGGAIEGESTLLFDIPKLKTATAKLTYKHADGVEKWDTKLDIESKDVTLPGGYALTGVINIATGADNALSFSGGFGITHPNGTTGNLALKRNSQTGAWYLSGTCTFKPPRLGKPITISATYVLASGILEATVKTPQAFNIPGGITGTLNELTIQVNPEGKIRAWGTGSGTFTKGKITGGFTVTLKSNGLWAATGKLSLALTDKLSVTGEAIYDEAKKKEERLVIKGTITVSDYEFFKEKSGEKQLFKVDATIPVPALSVGRSGVVINIGGGVKLAWKFGPGKLNLTGSATFNPLADDPEIALDFIGTAGIGASLSAIANIYAEGAVQIDAFVAKAGAAIGLELTGTAALNVNANAKVQADYKKRENNEYAFRSRMDLSADASVKLRLALDAYFRAYAETFFGWGKSEKWTWNLAAKEFDPGVKLYVSVPFLYSSDGGLVLPSAKDVSFAEPKVDAGATLKNSWAGSAPTAKEPINS